MKKAIRMLCLLLAALAAALCLVGCSLFGDDEDDMTATDLYGFARPSNCWLTDCLLLNEYPQEEKLFGTSGDSGLLSDYALQRDGVGLKTAADGSDTYQSVENYLVCLFYATPGSTVNIKTYLKFTLVNGTSALYDEDCVEVKDCQINTSIYDFWADLDMSLPADERLTVTLSGEAGAPVQVCLVIPFSVKGEGTLYADLRIENTAQSGSANYYVDGYSTADINVLGNAPGGTDASLQVNVQSFSIKYLTEANYNMGQYSDDKLTSAPSFDNGAISYMVLDFEFAALEDNDASHSINVLARVPESSVMVATIQEAPTGRIEEVTENNVTSIYANYSVPPTANTYKKVRMIVQLTPLDEGIANVDIFLVGARRESTSIATKTTGSNYVSTALVSGVPELRYTLSKDGKSYTATSLWRSDLAEINVPDEYKGLPVTGIASNLLKGNSKITSVTIGKNITSLASGMFSGCTNLRTAILGNGINSLPTSLFKDCTALQSVTLPAGTTSIPQSFFSGCKALTTVNGIGSVTKIGSSAFEDCSSLTQLSCGELTSVGTAAFRGCSSLKSVSTLRISEIPQSIFENCTSLQWFDLTGVTKINAAAFRNCKAFTQIVIPDSCKIISASSCFEGTSGVRSISLGKNVYMDGTEGKFFDKTSLESITVHPENPNYKSVGNCLLRYYTPSGSDEEVALLKMGCKTSVIPDNVVTIDQYAFSGCAGLTAITIPAKVTEISRSAFENCTSLKQITIPSGVQEIWQYAFRGCTSLTQVSGMKGNWYVAVGPKKDYSGEDKYVTNDNAAEYLTSTYCEKYFLRGGRWG